MNKRVEIDHFRHYQFAGSLKGSPGGGLAWLQKKADMKENRYTTDLWMLLKDTPLQLTSGTAIKGFWWLGDVLVFSALKSDEDKERAEKGFPLTVLYTISTRLPGEAQEWLRLDHDVSDIAFLPDGRFLFTAEWDAARARILAEAEDDETAARMLEESRACEAVEEIPFWADGAGFVAGKRNRLYLYNDGSITPITDEKTDVSLLRLSPLGTSAFFVANRFSQRQDMADRLMALRLDTLALSDITFKAPFVHKHFVPLDEDSLLVFGSDMARYGMNQNGHFYLYSLAARSLRTLEDSGLHCGWNAVNGDLAMTSEPRWCASDAGAYFIDTIGHASYLMHIGTDGAITQVNANEGAVHELAAAGASLYMLARRGMGAVELYRVEADGTEIRLSDINTHIPGEYSLSEPQPLHFTNSEGDEIHGWVIPPLGCVPGESYPGILAVHGGPKTCYSPLMMQESQYWAAEGFGVLYCNPTGSEGRGDEFADLRGRYGLVDYNDLMQFVDEALAAHPWLDPDRLGVTGGSYGGFMTNWIVGHTTRFAAAVAERSISNWFSMYGASDIGYFFCPDQNATTPWEDSNALWEQSPLAYANRVTTPTMLVHSEADYRCPYSEATQMFTALKSRGVKSRLVLFHGEGHELSRAGKPKNRVRRLAEITAWFKTYLRDSIIPPAQRAVKPVRAPAPRPAPPAGAALPGTRPAPEPVAMPSAAFAPADTGTVYRPSPSQTAGFAAQPAPEPEFRPAPVPEQTEAAPAPFVESFQPQPAPEAYTEPLQPETPVEPFPSPEPAEEFLPAEEDFTVYNSESKLDSDEFTELPAGQPVRDIDLFGGESAAAPPPEPGFFGAEPAPAPLPGGELFPDATPAKGSGPLNPSSDLFELESELNRRQ